MSNYKIASPEIQILLYKTISRESFSAMAPASVRYKGKTPIIDITDYLGEGSAVNVRKSIREPAGTFSISFVDRPQSSITYYENDKENELSIETIYALVEPMDMVEIRMWGGLGKRPEKLPVKMRGFVSDIARNQTMGSEGTPVRNVSITGHDYGKIWQMYQILYLPAYVAGVPLLSNFEFSELFGTDVENTIPARVFVSRVIDKIINPFMSGFIPDETDMPKSIGHRDYITVPNGVMNNAYQNEQGNVYDLLKRFGDVGIWNELFILDFNQSVECVYRVAPALALSAGDEQSLMIQEGALLPPIINILDESITNISAKRTDAGVANFFWVNNQRFDLINETYRKLFGLSASDQSIYSTSHQNNDPKLYGVRPLYGDSAQAGNDSVNLNSGVTESELDSYGNQFADWINIRRVAMAALNMDNSVFETGSLEIKGGPEREPDENGNIEAMKAGDYIRFTMGNLSSIAYITDISDQFLPYVSYKTTLTYERGNNFATRGGLESAKESPYLYENSTRINKESDTNA